MKSIKKTPVTTISLDTLHQANSFITVKVCDPTTSASSEVNAERGRWSFLSWFQSLPPYDCISHISVGYLAHHENTLICTCRMLLIEKLSCNLSGTSTLLSINYDWNRNNLNVQIRGTLCNISFRGGSKAKLLLLTWREGITWYLLFGNNKILIEEMALCQTYQVELHHGTG